jgi:PAS domain S-box-containing protein
MLKKGDMAEKTNILLVVDNRSQHSELEAILKPLQENVVKARSGNEALKYLLANDVAVILLDLDMAGMDRLETATLIREREKSQHTPIIFLTASRQTDLKVIQGSSLGSVDYVFKPVVPDILKSKVAAFVELFKQRRELQRQSALLKVERDFADAILDTFAGYVLVLDEQGRILRVNRAFEEATGFAFDEVRGRFFHEYLDDHDNAAMFFREPRGQRECRDYWLANGVTRRLVSWCCTSLRKEMEGHGRIVVTGRDITELRQRTEELEGFTYSVSHDMRAPVRAIDGFTRILIEEYAPSLDEEGRRLLDIVRQNTEKMGQLIDGLLALSRLGREKLVFAEIDMEELAAAAFEEERAAGGGQRNISFTVGDLPVAYGDKRLITQVFHNLLANAIKFTRKQPSASIEVGYQPGPSEDVYFVRDNGVGFDMDHAQKLFGTFQRLHAANEFEGSGIGLATVQRIIDRHGGRVWAEAKPNQGATFYFSLPLKEHRKAS